MSDGSSAARLRKHRALATLAVGLLVASVFPPAAQAADEQDRAIQSEQRKSQFEVSRMLRAGTFAGETDRKTFNTFYNLTMERFKLKGNRSELPKIRQRIARDLRNAGNAPNQAVHDALNTFLQQNMEKIAFDTANFDAVVRYNAMLQLADLNEKEPGLGGGVEKPLPAVLPVLVKGFSDDSLGEAVKVAALLGIQRHAASGVSDTNTANAISALMLKTLTDQKVPEDRRTVDAHDWIRRSAAEVLGSLGSVGTDGAVVKALLDVIKNPKESLSLRCGAAKALGPLNYSGSRLNFTLIGHALGGLAVEITEKHAEAGKRRIRAYLAGVMIGLGGPEPDVEKPAGMIAIAGEHQAFLNELFKQVMNINAIFDDSKLTAEETPEQVKQAGEAVKQLLANSPLQNQQLTVR